MTSSRFGRPLLLQDAGRGLCAAPASRTYTAPAILNALPWKFSSAKCVLVREEINKPPRLYTKTMTITQTFIRGPTWHVRNQGKFGRRMNHRAITHFSHLRIASGAATLFALPVCRFLITPRSVREVPLPPPRTSAKLLTLPRKWTSHTWGSFEAFNSSQVFSFFAKPYDQQPLRSSFVTASRRRLSRWVMAKGLPQRQPAAQIDQHSPNYSPAWRTEADRLLACAQLAHCHGATLRGRNDKQRARPSERRLQTREWVAFAHGDGLKGWGATGALPVLG